MMIRFTGRLKVTEFTLKNILVLCVTERRSLSMNGREIFLIVGGILAFLLIGAINHYREVKKKKSENDRLFK